MEIPYCVVHSILHILLLLFSQPPPCFLKQSFLDIHVWQRSYSAFKTIAVVVVAVVLYMLSVPSVQPQHLSCWTVSLVLVCCASIFLIYSYTFSGRNQPSDLVGNSDCRSTSPISDCIWTRRTLLQQQWHQNRGSEIFFLCETVSVLQGTYGATPRHWPIAWQTVNFRGASEGVCVHERDGGGFISILGHVYGFCEFSAVENFFLNQKSELPVHGTSLTSTRSSAVPARNLLHNSPSCCNALPLLIPVVISTEQVPL